MAIAQMAPPPLAEDADSVIRVGGTRIPLERVIFEWKTGASAESIVESFPVLDLADVYATIAYYLRHRESVEEYIGRREREAESLRAAYQVRFPQEGLRSRLLARLNR